MSRLRRMPSVSPYPSVRQHWLLVRPVPASTGMMSIGPKICSIRLMLQACGAHKRVAYLRMQMEIALQRGRLMQVLVFCQQVLEYEDTDQETVAPVGAVALQALEQMDLQQRQEAEFMFASTPVAGLLSLYALQTLDAGHYGEDTEAYQKALQLVRTAKSQWVREQAAACLDRFEGKTWRQHAVGVILPLSGRYAPFGRMVRQGIELAAAMHGDQAPELIFRDSRSDAGHTRKVMEDLVYTQRVMAVLGPLDGSPARVAALFAEQSKVPILLFVTPGRPAADRQLCVPPFPYGTSAGSSHCRLCIQPPRFTYLCRIATGK